MVDPVMTNPGGDALARAMASTYNVVNIEHRACSVCGRAYKVVTPEGIRRLAAHKVPLSKKRGKWGGYPRCPGSLEEVKPLD